MSKILRDIPVRNIAVVHCPVTVVLKRAFVGLGRPGYGYLAVRWKTVHASGVRALSVGCYAVWAFLMAPEGPEGVL